MNAQFDIIYGVVLAGALLHASWNALIKRSQDTLLSAISIAAMAAVLAACVLPLLPAPDLASWPYILVSLGLQVVYMRLVARIYRVADMSLSYPLMRGTAPLLVALISILFLHEYLSVVALLGISVLCGGILYLGLSSVRQPGQASGLCLILLNATVIASYTLVDGYGVRVSGAPASYTLWIFLLQGLVMIGMGLRTHPRTLWPYLHIHWKTSVAGGFASLVSYGTALWAMTLAPIAVIAALRETSILFGTLISGLILRERLTVPRVLGACVLVLGAILLRMA